jgi:hypothetical protein
MYWNVSSSLTVLSCFLLITTGTTNAFMAPSVGSFVSAASAITSSLPQKSTSLSLIPSSTLPSGVEFSDVVFPTYLGAAFVYLSYQMDRDSNYAKNLWALLLDDPPSALRKVAMVAGMGLVSVPVVAGIHALACTLVGGHTTSIGSISTPPPPAAAAAAAITSTGTSIPLSHVALPVSLGLAAAYVAYQVDQDSEIVVKLWYKLWFKYFAKTEWTEPSSVVVAPTTTTSILMEDETVDTPMVLVTEQVETTAVPASTTSTSTTTTSATTTTSSTAATPKKKVVVRVLQSLYAPWLEMIWTDDENSKRRKAAKFMQVLYLPWLPMFLPKKKEEEKNQEQAIES